MHPLHGLHSRLPHILGTVSQPPYQIPEMDLRNKSVLITAGSNGLGASIAHKFAAEGANVIINYNSSAQKATELADSLKQDFGVKAIALQGDATSKEGIHALVDGSLKHLGGLDVVISNVGWTKIVPYEDLESLDDELWDGCFNANVKSHFYLYKYCKPHLEKNPDGGVFIVTASIAGRMVYGSSIPYAVSKAALIHLVKMLSKSQGTKIRIHAVCPGLLMTDWGKRFPQATVDKALNLSPVKKIADVDETALHYTFLSKLTTSTGTIVGIDGGVLAA